MSESLLSTSQAAKWLGVSSSTLIRRINMKMIKPDYVTDGGHSRFSEKTLREFAQTNTGKGSTFIYCPFGGVVSDRVISNIKKEGVAYGWQADVYLGGGKQFMDKDIALADLVARIELGDVDRIIIPVHDYLTEQGLVMLLKQASRCNIEIIISNYPSN